MNAETKCLQRFVAVAVLVSVLLVPAMTALAKSPNPTVLPPNSHPYGMTYSEWGARWWQWLLGQGTVDLNSDTTGELCGIGQAGQVWFLAGAWGGSFTRECTVPKGKAIFFPVANWVYITFPWDPNDTVELAHATVKAGMDTAMDISAEIDGVALEELESYRVQSPEDQTKLFDLTLSEENLFGLPPMVYPTAADGIYLMLTPLSPGDHTINFHVQFPGYEPIDVTYNLTVQ